MGRKRTSRGAALRATALFVAVLLLQVQMPASIAGDGLSRTATVGVRAYVPPRVVVQSIAEPQAIDITADDVGRGYVDSPWDTRLELRSNSTAGIAIDVWPRVPLFVGAIIHTPLGDAHVGAEGGSIVQRVSTRGHATIALAYRFLLARELVPGRYTWPVMVNVRAL